MEKFGPLILRVVAAGTMLFVHGLDKFLHFSQYVMQFPDPIGVGAKTGLMLVVFAEVVCSAFVLLGLFTRIALIPLIITMCVAFFIVHAHDPFMKKELALMYLSVFSALFLVGPGAFSVQDMFKITSTRFDWLLK